MWDYILCVFSPTKTWCYTWIRWAIRLPWRKSNIFSVSAPDPFSSTWKKYKAHHPHTAGYTHVCLDSFSAREKIKKEWARCVSKSAIFWKTIRFVWNIWSVCCYSERDNMQIQSFCKKSTKNKKRVLDYKLARSHHAFFFCSTLFFRWKKKFQSFPQRSSWRQHWKKYYNLMIQMQRLWLFQTMACCWLTPCVLLPITSPPSKKKKKKRTVSVCLHFFSRLSISIYFIDSRVS